MAMIKNSEAFLNEVEETLINQITGLPIDRINGPHENYCDDAQRIQTGWEEAFKGWTFELPRTDGKRCMVVKSQCFYSQHSGGVQLYTYIFNEELNKWQAYVRGTPSELLAFARNFKKEEV